MGIATAWTLEEAREMVEEIKKAIKSIINGTAKSYKVGSREYTSLDLDELERELDYFSNIVEALEGKTRTTRVARIVPRDL